MLAPIWILEFIYLVQPAHFTQESACFREQNVPYFGKGSQWTVSTAGVHSYLQM